MDGIAATSVDALWDLVRGAVLLGWAATAVFCATAGIAVALWAGVRWWIGLLVGAVALYGGLLLLLLVGAGRTAARVRDARTDRIATTAVYLPVPAGGPARPAHPPVTGTGVRAGIRRGWHRWTRTPPTRTVLLVAVLTAVVAAGLVAATQVTWVELSAAGHGVTGFGPFAIQLGLFVVVSAVAAVVVAAGLLRWRSAWWPVLLAWFATWWLFVAGEVLSAEGSLDALNRLARDQVRERLGRDVRPAIALGGGWTLMIGLATAMLALAVVMLVLQARRERHYRRVARS